mmetsp:Transcript_25038/g.72278  ORF Transcript_25038/g.72278 Transcript_25038/m.72278 type:complete len:105 (+) Transcript_25038:693-1007(+)
MRTNQNSHFTVTTDKTRQQQSGHHSPSTHPQTAAANRVHSECVWTIEDGTYSLSLSLLPQPTGASLVPALHVCRVTIPWDTQQAYTGRVREACVCAGRDVYTMG